MELVAKAVGSQISRLALQRTVPSAKFSTSSLLCQAPNRKELNYEELSDLLTFNEDLALIDVRNSHELDKYGSIPGSINIPLSEVKAALQLTENEFRDLFLMAKPQMGTKNLVFFARGPNASSAALEIAHKLGYKGSRQYSGGWEDYCNKTGLPLKRNTPKSAEEQRTQMMSPPSYSIYNSYSM